MLDQQQIEETLRAIEERNIRVEADKAWETSLARRSIVAVMTYAIAAALLYSMGLPDPWLNALIPTAGYLLSTVSIPFVKKRWIARIRK